MATVTVRDPYSLLQDMYEMMALEAERLKNRPRDGDFDVEDASKQLQRLVTSLRGAIKDTEHLEQSRKDEFSEKSDTDLVDTLIQTPEIRRMLAEGLRSQGWTVSEPAPMKMDREERKKLIMLPTGPEEEGRNGK